MKLSAIFYASLFVAAIGHSAQPVLDLKAEDVIARSRTTTAVYTIYWRVHYSQGSVGSPEYAWGATFRKGPLVRVEDLKRRAVADCAAGTGTSFYLSIGRSDYESGKKIAQRYCGIDTDRKIRSTRWLGQKPSKFGTIDEVEIVDEDGMFVYQIAPAGELVGVKTSWRGSKDTVLVEPMLIEYGLPSGDLFSRMSLANSKVPKTIQSRASRADDLSLRPHRL